MQINSNGGCNLFTASLLHQLWFDCLQSVIRVLPHSELPASNTSDTALLFSDFRFPLNPPIELGSEFDIKGPAVFPSTAVERDRKICFGLTAIPLQYSVPMCLQ